MILELRKKSQITIPNEILKELGLSVGDKFEMFVKDGSIVMVPVTVYPKEYVKELEKQVKELEKRIANGEQKPFCSVDELMTDLEDNA